MGIQEDLIEIKSMLNDKKGVKEKKFRFPFGKKVGRSQKKKNYVITLVLNENGTFYFKKYQIIDQTIFHELIPRLATAGHVMFNKKGQPLIILPSWCTEPFSPKAHFDKSLNNGSNVKGFSILMNKMKSEQISSKKKLGNWIKWVGGFILLGIILYAVLTSGGG